MKKALKIILWTVAAILALVLLLVLAIPLWLGPTIASVATKVAPEYTGTPFVIDSVSINPYTGKYSVTKLNLGNPEGYPVPVAFSVSNVFVDVEMSSLVTDTIHIREITISDPYVSYVSKDGTNNFEWIAAHAKAKIGPQEEEEKEEDKGPGKKVVIDKLTIAGTHVKMKILPEMPIPTITLTDIGKEKGGTTWEEVGKMLVDAIMKATSAIGEGITSALGAVGDGASNLVDGASKTLGDTAKKIGNLGGLVGGDADGKSSETNKSAVSGVIDAGKSLGKGAADTGKAIGEGIKKLNPFGK